MCNTNVYWFSGNGATLGSFASTSAATISSWITLSGVDVGSGFLNPQFINQTSGNSTVNLHIYPYIPTPVEHNGTLISYITDDFDGQSRNSFTPTDIGADAGNFLYNPLPVTWIDFKARTIDHDVKLTWSTAAEINNSGFETERSTDGNKFEKINCMKGNGNSNSINNYEFIDQDAFLTNQSNVLFYRLKQVDFNNEFTFSTIVTVNKNQSKLNSVSVHPNPFVNHPLAYFVSYHNGKGMIELNDVSGRKIFVKELEITKGENSYDLCELSSFPPGIYFMRITSNGETYVNKLIKMD